MTCIYFAFFCAILAPLMDHQLPSAIHIPTDLNQHPNAFYLWFIFFGVSCYASALLGPNSCMFFGCLIRFLSNEFKILGISYGKTFDDLDNASDHEINIINDQFKKNISYHVQLMM